MDMKIAKMLGKKVTSSVLGMNDFYRVVAVDLRDGLAQVEEVESRRKQWTVLSSLTVVD